MTRIENPVSVKEFVRRLEKFNLDFYNNCLLKTNQFSTKYILQQAIKNQQDHQKELIPSMELLGTDEVDGRYLDDIFS